MDYREKALKLLPWICARYEDAKAGGGAERANDQPATHKPLAGLDKLLKK